MPNGVSRNAREVFRGSIPGWKFIVYDDDSPDLVVSFIMEPSGSFVSAYYLDTIMQLDSGLMLDGYSKVCLSFEEVQEIKRKLTSFSKKIGFEGKDGFFCPRCGRFTTECPALSRRDNRTEICSKCGEDEAWADFFGRGRR